MQNAKFITFEGGEGSGKSTQVKLLAEYLRGQGHEVITTREPGGTPLSEEIRKLLVHGGEMNVMTEILLNFASRVEHSEQVIKPALAQGKWVICDRFFDSTTVYQGFAGGVDVAQIIQIRKIVLGKLKPDITFLLDIPAELGLKRAEERGEQNRYETKGLEYHNKVREGFLKIAEYRERIKVIDATQEIGIINKKIIDLLPPV